MRIFSCKCICVCIEAWGVIEHTVLYIILTLIGPDDGGPVIKAYAVTQLIEGITASAVIDGHGVDISEVLGFMYILAFIIS